MRREPEHFDGIEPLLLYVARKLEHAIEVERLLTEAGIDFVLETDTFATGVVFRTERIGVFFYVAPEDGEAARGALEAHGFKLQVSTDPR